MEVSGMVGVCLGDLDSIEVLKIFASSGCLVICDVTRIDGAINYAWWVPYMLKNRDTIISAIKACIMYT